MPIRLSELVKHYPYAGKDQPEDGLLPRPRFSTRRYDALFVRISTELPSARTPKPKQHPLKLIASALKAEIGDAGEFAGLWQEIKNAASDESSTDEYPTLSRVFDDDTMRLITLVPTDPNDAMKTITLSTPESRESRPTRRRSTSMGPGIKANGSQAAAAAAVAAVANGKTPASPVSPAAVPLPASPTDWADFSSAGFGETALGKDLALTLLDSDVEVTAPPHGRPGGGSPKRRSSRKRKSTTSPSTSRRSSVDNPRPLAQQPSEAPSDPLKTAKTQTSVISPIKLDEAFVDFWSDSLTDPLITSGWPSFVLCRFKSTLPIRSPSDGKPLSWLVIEHAFTYPPAPPTPASEPTSPGAPKRASSPRPSLQSNISSSRKSSTFSSRFSFFSNSAESKGTSTPAGTPKIGFNLKSPTTKKRGAKAPRTGEPLAEIEESPKPGESENALGLGISGTAASERAEPSHAPNTTAATDANVPASSKEPIAAKPQVLIETVPTPEIKDLPITPAETPAVSPIVANDSKESTPASLPPVPVVDIESTPTVEAPSHVTTEPVKLGSQEKPTLSHPEAVPDVSSSQEVHADTAPASADDADTLPPAPEPVVLTGSTPGPQVALSTSEPAALAEAAVPETPDVIPPQSAEATTQVEATIPETTHTATEEPQVATDVQIESTPSASAVEVDPTVHVIVPDPEVDSTSSPAAEDKTSSVAAKTAPVAEALPETQATAEDASVTTEEQQIAAQAEPTTAAIESTNASDAKEAEGSRPSDAATSESMATLSVVDDAETSTATAEEAPATVEQVQDVSPAPVEEAPEEARVEKVEEAPTNVVQPDDAVAPVAGE